ncbi:CPCC family cysteine-rich protein [Nocardioides ganghwensis]|uniref:Hydrolase n=1 Tax=Nocardioides ganghwensis TaxID=252230 RepID=A0A4Q2SJL0_9ACTN|nr:hydrolase [Nocardioides ganghwensis]RYC04194.1 hydrolase [Nocardioides ganghwensis]
MSTRAEKYTCPCCGHRTLPEAATYEICPVCLWEDDGVSTDNPQQWGEGPNGISLAEGQARYRQDGRVACDAPPHFCARPPREDEPLDPDWRPFVENG